MLTRLGDVFPRLFGVSVGLEQILADDVQFLALLEGQVAGLLHYVMHVHQICGDVAYLLIALSHYSVLQFEIDSHFVVILLILHTLLSLFCDWLLQSLLNSTAVLPCTPPCILNSHRRKRGHLGILRSPITNPIIFLLCLNRMKQLLPAVSLYSELLLDGAYFAGGVGIEVRVL